ncbi:MarR family winged helix-turn-helix transcriptional regulator [Streptomyces spiralis]
MGRASHVPAPVRRQHGRVQCAGTAGPGRTQGMRMSELAQRRLMSAGGFTRLADRLEQRGLIERRRSPGDGRGFEAVLTSDGRALLRKAWRRRYSDLRRLFLDRLDDEHLRNPAEVRALRAPDDDGVLNESSS